MAELISVESSLQKSQLMSHSNTLAQVVERVAPFRPLDLFILANFNFIHPTHASHVYKHFHVWQVQKVCELSELRGSGQGRARIPLEEFGRVLRRFSTLAAPDALELIDEVAWQSRVLTSDALRWKTYSKNTSGA